jgi:hypothetical protein
LLKKTFTTANMGIVKMNYGDHFLNDWGVIIGAVGRKV